MTNVIFKIDDHHELVIATFLFPIDAVLWVENCTIGEVYVQE